MLERPWLSTKCYVHRKLRAVDSETVAKAGTWLRHQVLAPVVATTKPAALNTP
jgi:hypothetical protein